MNIRSSSLICLPILLIYTFLTEACGNAQDITYARYYTTGKSLYDQHCQNCHHTDGSGLGNLIPPLTDTIYVKNNISYLACIIKHGFSDSIIVSGKVYLEKMPSNHQLPDIDIAALVTYISNTFGNKQGLYDVSKAGKDLKNCQH